MADNPFNYSSLLDPGPRSQGTMMGFIGGLMGSPTARQAAGSATGAALQELSALRDQGMPPQQALIKFLQTPNGQAYFTNAGPNGLKSLVEGLQATVPPAPTMHNVPEGGQLYATSPGSGDPKMVAQNPKRYPNQVLGPQDKMVDAQGNPLAENTNVKPGDTPANVQSFKYFSALANLPQAEIKRLAALQLDPSANKATVESNAIDDLVSRFNLDPALGEKMKAGAIKVLPLKNSVGQDTGAVTIVDLTTGDVRMVDPNKQGTPATNTGAPSEAPAGTSPATGARTGALPAVKPQLPKSGTEGNAAFGSKDDMALGAGPVSKVLGAATTLSEAVDPKLIIEEGAKARDRETMLNTLRSNLQSIGTIGGGMSSNKGLIEGYVKTYLDQGFFTSSPHSQVSKLIRLHETAEKNIAEETERAQNPNLPNEVKKQAFETVAGWQRVLSSMPDYKTLINQEKAIRAGTAGAPTVSGAANTLVKSGAKALTEGKKQAGEVDTLKPQDFDAMPTEQLLAIDPRTLDRAGKIKLLRRLDALKKGGAK
jgi:hypothetical protein